MVAIEDNPFAILTLIAAPAVLTNACSLLALNTANRFGRAIDRSRWLTIEMDRLEPQSDEYAIRERQLARAGRRALWLLKAQTAFYAALGLFVVSALLSVLGAVLATIRPELLLAVGAVGLSIGTLAAMSLVYGCAVLVHETRLAVSNIEDDVVLLSIRSRARAAKAVEA